MAKVYARMITSGKLTLEEVPTRWRDQVAALLGQGEEE